jgi:hypothetical protein
LLLEYLLVVGGLSLFEVINSIDNAIINSEVLSTMSEKSRKWFLSWGGSDRGLPRQRLTAGPYSLEQQP